MKGFVLRAILVGLGNVSFDLCDIESKNTHFGSCKLNDIEILLAIDSNFSRRNAFTTRTGIHSIANAGDIRLCLDKVLNIDLIIVAVSTTSHFQVIKELLHYITPRIIVCEKPFCSTESEANEIQEICNSKSISLVVSYQRNFTSKYFTLLNTSTKQTFFGGYLFISPNLEIHGCHLLALALKSVAMLEKTSNEIDIKISQIQKKSFLIDEIVEFPTRQLLIAVSESQYLGFFFSFLEFENLVIVISNNHYQIFRKKRDTQKHYWLNSDCLISEGDYTTDFFSFYSSIRETEYGSFDLDLSIALKVRRFLSQIV